jgi:prepilin-type N-terminal cleavage/methylation domain-containing protein
MNRRSPSYAGFSSTTGFTLIEIVITIVLVGVIGTIAAMIIMEGVAAYSEGDRDTALYYQARLGMDRMARDLRQIRSTDDISTWTATDLRYIDAMGAAAGFNWASPALRRWNGTGNDTLATGITTFNFSYLQQDGTTPAADPADLWFIDISLTAQQDGTSLAMRTRVHPRNF